MAFANARKLPCFLAVLCTVLALPTQAGTPEAPEMPDAPGDACLDLNPGSPVPTVPCAALDADALDVVAAWVDAPDTGNVSFHLEIAANPPVGGAGVGTTAPVVGCREAGADFAYLVHFQTFAQNGTPLVTADADGNTITDLYVAAQGACDSAARVGGAGLDFLLAHEYESSEGTHLVTEGVAGSVNGTTLTWILPRDHTLLALPLGDAAGGFQIGGLLAQSGMLAQGLVVSALFSSDLAPDTGYGANFTFPAPAATVIQEEDIVNETSSSTTVTLVQTRTETQVVTETQSFVETVTATFAPDSSSSKAAPGAGILVAGLLVVLAVVRRRLP